MTYQQLAVIADCYIPLLIIIAVALWIKKAVQVAGKMVFNDILATVTGSVYIYILMFSDAYLGLFASLGLDYSTHTALALVFVVSLCFVSKRASFFTSISLVSYCLLMQYQSYHTIADMVLTALITLPVLIWIQVHYQYRSHQALKSDV